MLSVLRVHLPSDIPIVGCELSPYVQLRCPDSSVTVEDVPESAPLDGFYLRCRWYRIHSDKRIAVCSVHPSELATLQCLGCLKTKLPVSKSYHCSAKCFSDSWRYHRSLHARAASAVKEASAEEEELFSRFNSTGPAVIGQGGSGINLGSVSSGNVNNGPPYVSIRTSDQSGGEKWYEVGQGKVYTPSAEDIGCILKLECVIVSLTSGMAVGGPTTLLTGRVIPAPSPTPRRMVSVNSADGNPVELEGRVPAPGTFTVMSYNVLAHLYATSEMYSYCPSWALSWTYRRQNLLREIVGYRADIICLQEVQSDHFEEYFSPELEKHGYAAVYKRKTTEVYTGSAYAIDGCATFFKRDRFLLVKKYEVEFNKAAQSMSEAVVHPSQRKTALTRLLKDNVALIVVLESQDSIHGMELPSATNRRQLICVANTHINANPELKDVKLWQVHTLLKGLEKIAASADIPMLVVGDFNSLPGSAPHSLLATGSVDPGHPELDTDPLGILHPPSKLCHQLPLRSAYSAFSRMTGTASNCERQRQRIDSTTSEPLFTNCTRDFLGTLDYIFYTGDSLVVESLLELLDEDSLRKDTALPSPEWSSDHIALLAEFRCRSRPRR